MKVIKLMHNSFHKTFTLTTGQQMLIPAVYFFIEVQVFFSGKVRENQDEHVITAF